MILADGTLRAYTLENIAAAGEMPVSKLVPKFPRDIFYGDRVIGFSRQYAAFGVDQVISKLVRIWDMPIEIGDYVIIGDEQFRVDNAQPLRDEDDLKVRDLTLSKVEDRYDCIAPET